MLALYLGWVGNVQTFHGDLRGALASIERALELGRSANARNAVAHALAWGTHTLMMLGRMADAIRAAESLEQSDGETRLNPYPHFKSQAGLSLALAYSGRLGRARRVAEDLVEFGRARGNARAETLGQMVLSAYGTLTLDFERAAMAAQIGMDVAKDPNLRATNGVFRIVGLLADMRFEEARRVIDDCLPFLEENENYWFGQPARGCRAAVDLASGQLSSGMRGGLDSARSLREAGFEAPAFFTDVFNLLTYVSIARRDITPAFGALLRNPWFIFTQAPFAARKARRLIDRLRTEAEEKDLRGFHGLILLAEGRLLAHQGKKAQAREVLARIHRFLADAGVEHVPAPVGDLAAEVETGARAA